MNNLDPTVGTTLAHRELFDEQQERAWGHGVDEIDLVLNALGAYLLANPHDGDINVPLASSRTLFVPGLLPTGPAHPTPPESPLVPLPASEANTETDYSSGGANEWNIVNQTFSSAEDPQATATPWIKESKDN